MKFPTVSAVRVYEPLATLIGNRDHQGTFTQKYGWDFSSFILLNNILEQMYLYQCIRR
jgi:hypothetical protein